MQKIVLLVASLVSSAALAAPDGFYLGLQAGYGDNGFDESQAIIPMQGMSADFSKTSTRNYEIKIPDTTNQYYSLQPLTYYKSKTTSNNLAGRLFAGWKFNSIFATELGYTQFGNSTLTINGSNTYATSTANVTANRELISKIQARMLDVTTKWIYEVQNPGLSFYGKLGAAMMNVKQQAQIIDSVTVNPLNTNLSNTLTAPAIVLDNTTRPIRPLVGAGIDFDLSDNAEMDIEVTYIPGTSFLPDSKFGSINFAYHFV